jgi:hypothetical protein
MRHLTVNVDSERATPPHRARRYWNKHGKVETMNVSNIGSGNTSEEAAKRSEEQVRPPEGPTRTPEGVPFIRLRSKTVEPREVVVYSYPSFRDWEMRELENRIAALKYLGPLIEKADYADPELAPRLKAAADNLAKSARKLAKSADQLVKIAVCLQRPKKRK